MMSTAESAVPAAVPQSRTWLTILWIGLFAGTLDITDSLIFNLWRGISPKIVFQFIASGLLGPQAFHVGAASVALGVAIHYTIALTWTALFYFASRKFEVLLRRPVISGMLYGCGVYLFMNLVALPLSRVPHINKITLVSRINGVLAVVLLIGVTIALLVKRSSPDRLIGAN